MVGHFARKSVDQLVEEGERTGLKRVLGPWGLTALGIGSIIGTGIFVLTGIAAATKAGPAIMLSFLLAAFVCACSGLCYAELASMIPVAGSAYTYAYATVGRIFAWIIGWDLLLEYAVGNSAVAIGWASYFNHILKELFHWEIPAYLMNAPGGDHGGLFNLPAFLIVMLITVLLVRGIQESAKANNIMVGIKLAVLILFLAVGATHINPANWHPFFPFGYEGIVKGAGLVFFAYIGFDAVSTAAEESKNPQKDLPFGILMSLFVCTALYMAVAAVMTGAVPYTELNVEAPVAHVLSRINQGWAASLVSVGAIAGITTVLLVLTLGQTRILYAMSRDGMLPAVMSRLHPKFATPHINTWVVGLFTALGAAVIPIHALAEMTNIGTLFAFALVCVGVLYLRKVEPDRARGFRTPWVPIIPIAGCLSALYLMVNESAITQLRFVIWLVIGLVIYFAGYYLAKGKETATTE